MRVYQLWRVPSKSPCEAEVEEKSHQEILDSLKECLQHRWDCAQLEEEQKQSSTSASRPAPQAEYWNRMCTTYDHYKDVKEGLCKEALAIMWDAH